MFFIPRDKDGRAKAKEIIERALASRNLQLLMWREVPVNLDALGEHAFKTRPYIAQALIARGKQIGIGDAYERALYFARKEIERLTLREKVSRLYAASLSSRTIVYKGLFVSPMIGQFYFDLRDPLFGPRWRWCINATAPIPFPRGNLHSPFGACVTTGKSIRCRAISRGMIHPANPFCLVTVPRRIWHQLLVVPTAARSLDLRFRHSG